MKISIKTVNFMLKIIYCMQIQKQEVIRYNHTSTWYVYAHTEKYIQIILNKPTAVIVKQIEIFLVETALQQINADITIVVGEDILLLTF